LFATAIMLKVTPSLGNSFGKKMPDGGANLAYRPLIGLIFSSLTEMGAGIAVCTVNNCGSFQAYAVALGASSLFICIIMLLANCGNSTTHSSGSARFQQVMGFLLFLWWLIGTGILTFDHPFQTAGNGFFACYASIFFSWAYFRACRVPM
jgi:hypothetical protein